MSTVGQGHGFTFFQCYVTQICAKKKTLAHQSQTCGAPIQMINVYDQDVHAHMYVW